MKKSYLILFICLLFVTIHVDILTGQGTYPQRAAEGQTKWLNSQLKINESILPVIYRINLYYQMKADSVHMANITTAEKKDLYLLFSQRKKDEFRQILTPDQYNKYLLILESIRTKTPIK